MNRRRLFILVVSLFTMFSTQAQTVQWNSNKFSWEDFLVEVTTAVKDMTDGKQVPLYHYDLSELPMYK